MKITTHLIVTSSGNVRVTKRKVGIKPTELCITLNVNIPDSFFRRPQPVVNLSIPDTIGQPLPVDQVIDLSADMIAESLGINVEDVRDGLQELVSQQDND